MARTISRQQRIDPDDDLMWEQIALAAAARLPYDLTPPLSDLNAPGTPAPDVEDQTETEVEVSSDSDTEATRKPKKKRGPRTTRYKNITRMDYPKNKGYFVRVRWNKVSRSKLFSDGVYGDRLAALAAAIAWRDKMIEELGQPPPGKKADGSMVGIHRRIRDGQPVYEATWSVNGKRGRTMYSVRKHGAKKARALAIAARQRAMQDQEKQK